MKPRRRLGLGLLTALGLLVCTEGLLWAYVALTGDDLRSLDPLARDMDQPVLCGGEDALTLCPAHDGSYHLVRQQRFARRPERPRVIAVGESFVFGLGFDQADSWPGRLQAQLGDRFEVLNFGKCGSESTTLMPVVAAAIDLSPDLLVLAIGNNEYAMAPYYGGLAGRHPVLAHDLLGALGRLQLYGLLDRGVGGRLPSRAGQALGSFGGHPMQAEFEALHRRPPDTSGFAQGLAEPAATLALEASKRLAERLYAARLAAMVSWAKEQDIATALATVPRNPVTRPLVSGLHRIDRHQAEPLLARLDAAGPTPRDPLGPPRDPGHLALAREAVQADPRVAIFQWHLGVALWRTGQRDAALEAWEEARQWDLAPDSTPATNDAVRRLARQQRLPLIDLDHHSAAWVGDHRRVFFKDQVHMAPDGAEAIAALVADALSDPVPGWRWRHERP